MSAEIFFLLSIVSCIGAPRAPVQGFIYTDMGCNRHEVPIVTDLLVCVAQWYARMLIRYI